MNKNAIIIILSVIIIGLGVLFIIDSKQNKNQSESINNLTKTTMKSISPNLMVADVDATIEYYKSNLGFETVMVVDEEKGDGKTGKPLVWGMIKKGEVVVMLQREDGFVAELPEMEGREIGGTFTMYISMKNTKEFYEDVKGRVEIVKELHKTWYGANEFVIKDNNGYIIYFAEVQEAPSE